MSQYIAGRIEAIIGTYGEPMTLRRPGDTDVDVALQAARMGATAENAVQGQTTSTIRIRIGNAEIAAQVAYTLPIQVGRDQIIDADGRVYVIKAADTKKPGDVVAMHVLTVEG